LKTARHWGLEPDEWSAARERLRRLLSDTAARRATVTYGDAAAVAFDGRFSARSGALMDLLGEVDAEEERERGVMIASLVVRADTGMPGQGYFGFARDVLHRDTSDPRTFWRDEAEAVWAAYGEGLR
jgi:hypothetical protein